MFPQIFQQVKSSVRTGHSLCKIVWSSRLEFEEYSNVIINVEPYHPPDVVNVGRMDALSAVTAKSQSTPTYRLYTQTDQTLDRLYLHNRLPCQVLLLDKGPHVTLGGGDSSSRTKRHHQQCCSPPAQKLRCYL